MKRKSGRRMGPFQRKGHRSHTNWERLARGRGAQEKLDAQCARLERELKK